MCGVVQSRPRMAFLFAVAIQYLAGQGVGALPVANMEDRFTPCEAYGDGVDHAGAYRFMGDAAVVGFA